MQEGRHAILDLAGRWGRGVWSRKLEDALSDSVSDARPGPRPIVSVVYPVVTNHERLQETVIRRMMSDASTSGRVGLRLCFNLGVRNRAESLADLTDTIQGEFEAFLEQHSSVFSNVILLGNDWRDGLQKHRTQLYYLRIDDRSRGCVSQPLDPDAPCRLLLESWLDEVGDRLHPRFRAFLLRKARERASRGPSER